MQVDLEKLKGSIREELSKLEERKSRLEEGVVVIEKVQNLAGEFVDPGEGDSPGSESVDSLGQSS